MNPIGWVYKKFTGGEAPAGTFKEYDFDFKAMHMKVRTATSIEISFDGVNTHISQVAADGLKDYDNVMKGKIWYKGSGDLEVTAWDGN